MELVLLCGHYLQGWLKPWTRAPVRTCFPVILRMLYEICVKGKKVRTTSNIIREHIRLNPQQTRKLMTWSFVFFTVGPSHLRSLFLLCSVRCWTITAETYCLCATPAGWDGRAVVKWNKLPTGSGAAQRCTGWVVTLSKACFSSGGSAVEHFNRSSDLTSVL